MPSASSTSGWYRSNWTPDCSILASEEDTVLDRPRLRAAIPEDPDSLPRLAWKWDSTVLRMVGIDEVMTWPFLRPVDSSVIVKPSAGRSGGGAGRDRRTDRVHDTVVIADAKELGSH